MINTVIAPTTITEAETFIWYQANPRLSLGVAHLYKQNSFRWLASINILPESAKFPGINASAGVQGIGTGNPGYSVTAEKNWTLGEASLNVYSGAGFRSNENHAHGLVGLKYTTPDRWTFGFQNEGHQTHPFVTYSWDQYTTGLFLINGKSPAYMIGVRF
ncbi:hypothetical protein C0431_13860 [bacterium]|nr:hypothetical protein [bacterium]